MKSKVSSEENKLTPSASESLFDSELFWGDNVVVYAQSLFLLSGENVRNHSPCLVNNCRIEPMRIEG
jgi:hypothetical protein